MVSADSSLLYVSNFDSNTVAVYDIDTGKVVATLPAGSHPDAVALSRSQNYVLVLDSQSGDVTVIQKRTPTKLEPTEYSLLTMIPVGVQPNNIVVKSFVLASPRPRRNTWHGFTSIFTDMYLPELVTPVTFVP